MTSGPPPALAGWSGFGLHSDSDDGAHTKLHHLHVVAMFKGDDGASLQQELIHTHQAHIFLQDTSSMGSM